MPTKPAIRGRERGRRLGHTFACKGKIAPSTLIPHIVYQSDAEGNKLSCVTVNAETKSPACLAPCVYSKIKRLKING
jgi:hypothetical protein